MYVNILASRYDYSQQPVPKRAGEVTSSGSTGVSGTASQNYVADMSPEGLLRTEYQKRLKDSIERNKDKDSSFVESLALEYSRIKDEILKDSPGNERSEKLKALDEVFGFVAKAEVGKLAGKFENFFDYSANTLSMYGMNHNKEMFDVNKFSEHLFSILNSAKEIVKKAGGNISLRDLKTGLESIDAQNSDQKFIEYMSYRDIRGLEGIIKKCPVLDPKDPNPENAMFSLYELVGAVDDSRLSVFVKDTAVKALFDTIGAYHKVTAYEETMDMYQREIDELNRARSPLKKLYAKVENFIEKYKKENNAKMLAFYNMKKLDIWSELQPFENRLKDLLGSQASLKSNPDTVTSTEAYKDTERRFARLVSQKLEKTALA